MSDGYRESLSDEFGLRRAQLRGPLYLDELTFSGSVGMSKMCTSLDVGVQSIARRLWATLQAWFELEALPMEAIRATFGPPVSCKRQVDFAREPLVAPIKTHLTPELANYVFHDARAETAVRGRRNGRPTRLDPAQAEPSVCCKGPCDFNVTTRRR